MSINKRCAISSGRSGFGSAGICMRKHLLEEDNHCNFRASGRGANNLRRYNCTERQMEIEAEWRLTPPLYSCRAFAAANADRFSLEVMTTSARGTRQFFR